MKYIRVYADEKGDSHYEDVEVELTARDFAPPAPPLQLSPMTPATGVAFVRFPAGWDGDWHPTPRRQFFFFLTGELRGRDERRRSAGATAREAQYCSKTRPAEAIAPGWWATVRYWRRWCSWRTEVAGPGLG